MRALDIEQVGNELAVKWDDGGESFLKLEELRRHCPCAACKGEVDVMGHLHIGPKPSYSPRSFQLARLMKVGGYGVSPVWMDGHSSGIYTWEYLRALAADG